MLGESFGGGFLRAEDSAAAPVTPGQSQKEIPNLILFTMQALKMNLPDLRGQLDS